MHRFTRTCAAVLTLLLAGAAWAPPAPAAIERIAVNDDDATRTFGGSADHLPVRPNLTWREAVAWARTMPAVQIAMQTCAARGYVALSVHDSALVSIDPPATAVIFPYQRPGLVLGPFQYGQPLLVVVTTLSQEAEPATRVSAGLVILDAEHEAAFTADSLPAYATSDASFDVVAAAGDGGPENRRYSAGWSWPGWFNNQESRFNKFIRCWGINSLATCIRPLLNFTRTPVGAVITYTEPQDLAFYMAFCALGTGLGCEWAVW